MNLPATLYTIAAIGFFALMASRPMVEMPVATASTEATPAMVDTNPDTSTEATTTSTEVTTPNAPPQDSDTAPGSSQPAATTNTN